MNKKIKINGEFTKEELQEILKGFDALKWEIKSDQEYISLLEDGKIVTLLLNEEKEIGNFNISTVSRDIAIAMDDLMETKDVLDKSIIGYHVYFDARSKCGYANNIRSLSSNKHFKTALKAGLAVKLLNKSVDMQDGIQRMSE